MRFFVVCPGGLEVPLAQELASIAQRPDCKALGAWVIDPTPTSPTGGVGLAAPLSAAMALNLHSRIASRVLLQMADSPYYILVLLVESYCKWQTPHIARRKIYIS